jgi:16S rRNA (guanine527-N7)-methyltransferase
VELITRLAGRAAGWRVAVTTAQLALIRDYLVLLAQWNQAMNLTALPLQGFPDAALDRLVGEALLAAANVPLGTRIWFDLGSGSGSPAIPMKVASPGIALTMVESRQKKAAFLREVVRRLGLESTVVLNDRFERLDPALASTADLVTVRAIRIDTDLLAVVGALLRPGAVLMLFTSSAPPAAATGRQLVPEGLDIQFREISKIPLPGPDSWLRILERQSS